MTRRMHQDWLKPTDKYRHCNHYHELTKKHEIVDFWDWEFVANKDWIPLLKALNEIWLKTRTHHIEKWEHCFISVLLDNVTIEIREVNETADRTKYNGKKELLLLWKSKKK